MNIILLFSFTLCAVIAALASWRLRYNYRQYQRLTSMQRLGVATMDDLDRIAQNTYVQLLAAVFFASLAICHLMYLIDRW